MCFLTESHTLTCHGSNHIHCDFQLYDNDKELGCLLNYLAFPYIQNTIGQKYRKKGNQTESGKATRWVKVTLLHGEKCLKSSNILFLSLSESQMFLKNQIILYWQERLRYTDWKWEGKVTSKWQMCAPFKLKNLGASVPLCDVSCKYAWASNSGEWDQKVLTGWGAGPPGYPKAGVWGTKAGSLKEAVSREWAALGIYCKRHIVRFKRKQKLAASSMFHKPVGFYWCCFCFFFF